MTKDKELKLALEALIGSRTFLKSDTPVEVWEMNTIAINECVKVLAQPEQKPLTDEQWQVIADTLDCLITRKQKDAIEAVIGIKE